jgi:predicted nuclease of predicted toxin-antitoxin system
MRLVVDMCLPPDLAAGLASTGHDAVHWSSVGDPKALDLTIMEWAKHNGSIIVTHDLDFGDLLFASKDHSPSVIIIREKDTHVDEVLEPVLRVLAQFEHELRSGSLIAMTRHMARVRRLPLG